MSTHRYTLERGSRKHVCPACGQKRLVRYVDLETGSYLADHVGRCDREQQCGYHCPPREFLSQQVQLTAPHMALLQPRRAWRCPQPMGPEKVSLIEPGLLRQSLKAYEQNHFVAWLLDFLSLAQVQALLQRFWVGTSKHWPGATVFWQVDKVGYIRTGKVMLYHRETGRRVKEPFPHQTFVHALLKRQGKVKDFHLRQCLFGEHQLAKLPQGSPVALVESEKTAMLMTAYLPAYTWVACGGLQMLNEKACVALRGYEVRCFPDLGGFELWEAKAEKLRQAGFKVWVSDLLEQRASQEAQAQGWDLGDYILPYLKGQVANQVETQLGTLCQLNPQLLRLIEGFSLTQTTEGQTVNLARVKRKAAVKAGCKPLSSRQLTHVKPTENQ